MSIYNWDCISQDCFMGKLTFVGGFNMMMCFNTLFAACILCCISVT